MEAGVERPLQWAAPVGAPGAVRFPKSNAGQSDAERQDAALRSFGAPWVPDRAAVAAIPGESGWIPAPNAGCLGPPAFLLTRVSDDVLVMTIGAVNHGAGVTEDE